jgi:hypothetical protein
MALGMIENKKERTNCTICTETSENSFIKGFQNKTQTGFSE